jgi:hypothetical protein
MSTLHRRWTTASVAVLLATGAAAVPAHAGDLWVDGGDPSCSDARSAAQVASPATPWCSVSHAASVAQAGDAVRVRAGVYRGTVRPASSGSATAPIRFLAAEPGVVLEAGGAANAIKLIGVSDVDFDGFEVRGGASQGVWVQGGAGISLSELEIHANAGAGVTVKGSTGLVVEHSRISGNGGAGVMELGGTANARYHDDTIASNGANGSAYNGDGIQLGGTGAVVTDDTITGNGGTSAYQHGVYASSSSSGWTIERSVLTGNAGADVKAAGGPGTIRLNRIGDARWGVILSDNPVAVTVEHNVIAGRAQHLVFLTAGSTPARARIWANTIVQTGRSTASGDASAIFVNAAAALDMRDNLVCYANPDALGVALWINDATRTTGLTSDTNWFCGQDARARHLAWNGSRTTLAGWRAASAQDANSIASAPPAFDDDLRVTSANLGAGLGANLGLATDVAGTQLPSTGPVDIGAYQSPDGG